jgi:hypothetical protein
VKVKWAMLNTRAAATDIAFYIGLGDQFDDDRRLVCIVEDTDWPLRTRTTGANEPRPVKLHALGPGPAEYVRGLR